MPSVSQHPSPGQRCASMPGERMRREGQNKQIRRGVGSRRRRSAVRDVESIGVEGEEELIVIITHHVLEGVVLECGRIAVTSVITCQVIREQGRRRFSLPAHGRTQESDLGRE